MNDDEVSTAAGHLERAVAVRRESEEVRPATPLDDALDTMSHHLDRLSTIVGRMVDRLQPVLRDEDDKMMAAERIAARNGSPLATRIDTMGTLLDMESDRLARLLDRLDV